MLQRAAGHFQAVQSQPLERLSGRRVSAAKRAFSTRRVNLEDAQHLVHDQAPVSGDLVLAEVVSVGHHRFLESPEGRRCTLHCGDTVLVAYGARYAPDQFEGVIPPDLRACHLLAAGGIAGEVVTRHSAARVPTSIKPVGLLADRNGAVLNLRNYRIDRKIAAAAAPAVIAVVGTSMNAGKTQAASNLIRGLTFAGLSVAAAKLTGTGSGGDLWSMVDSGAQEVLDFTDAGFATTHQADAGELKSGVLSLLDHLSMAEHDVIVVEIADGLLQRETAILLESPEIQNRLRAIIFAASDSLGAVAGVEWLRNRSLPPIALAGVITASPLASAEAEAATGLTSYTSQDLSNPELAPKLCFSDGEDTRAHLRQCG